MTHPNSFAFDDFVVWPPSEPPDLLADYTTGIPTDRLSSKTSPSTDADADDVALASQSTARRDRGLSFNGRERHRADLVLVPRAFWAAILQPKLEKLLDKKLLPNKAYKAEETNVVVSVTDRSERDLVKRFDELDIEWAILERQLQAWSRLFRAGKKLRIQMSFKYVETSRSRNATARQATKRVFSSTSDRMLSERAMQLDAEEVSGHPSIWREVYNLMRFPGPPCHLGPYCWRDSIGNRHYKLKTHHLRNLIKCVEQGCSLQTHDDMPHEIREQLYAKEAQYAERQRKQGASQANFPPINITNVMPATPQASTLSSVPATPESTGLVSCDHSARLEIPGLRDIAVKRYCDWQCWQVSDEALKMEYWKACDLTLAYGLDLEQVFKDQDAAFYIDNSVKRGIARRVVSDIGAWAQQQNF
ncbi:hypothetical protein CHGG_05589 [Chaetomium globosum CBS 148.51]|uniref:Uncharacterized protein n=1 Tax=Chaetomium globosum (strain ATCC 6205 / CBS 148.51 / DSM 1962 / NBRC 6347 / NRRL 1970) TaxID=306901 RepID=Q2H6X6_CHAGB|nr:uncharacterized protein CHGG_05589 [Chaetomium globosum CBS 148.51]EAQ88970.1 hypothetical protein CHGG_05589 [Chaetomium globosum CBS 148.51]